ncbi:TlpA family protein disulfide reductase [Sphingomonas solaris]|nr:TlpA disulfide reductase family protein [Sphingomonas solaris]
MIAIAAMLIACATPTVLNAKPRIGEPAPDFSVQTFDGATISLASLRGRVVLLNFWATWCGPCKVELPLLDGYHRLQKDAGLSVIAVTTEDSAPVSRLKPLAAAVSFPMVRRLKGPYAILGAVPTNYIIDRNGILRYARAAAFTLDDLNDLLVPLLREPAPAAIAAR